MSSISNNLIGDLTDIMGTYISDGDYTKLMKNDPKVFTKQKLVKNMTENIPLHELILFSKAYNFAKRWKESRIDEYECKYTKPIELVGLFVKYIQIFGDTLNVEDMNDLCNIEYMKEERNIHNNKIGIEEELGNELGYVHSDIIKSINTESLLSKFLTSTYSDEYKNMKMKKFMKVYIYLNVT
jgi:hypothetical protein